MTSSDTTKIAVLTQKVDDLKEDVKEVKSLVSDKIATKEYVNDKVNPLKKLLYWLMGILSGVIVAASAIIIGLVVNNK